MERPEVGDELAVMAQQSIWHPDYRETIKTPALWNDFAMAFSLADRFPEAERCFERIGDTLVTRQPWAYRGKAERSFLKLRSYVRDNL
jgi:hypothetical protein